MTGRSSPRWGPMSQRVTHAIPLSALMSALTSALMSGALALPARAEPPPGESPQAATAMTAAAVVPGNLGTNLGGITYYDGNVPFVDLVKQAGDWVPNADYAGWGEGPALRLRGDGWPSSLQAGQVASTVIADVHYPRGTYSVSWRGKGSFDINGRTFLSTAASGGGTGTVSLDGYSTTVLNIRSTDPADPVRSISVRAPGEAPGALFRAAYLRQLKPYKVLRFMDWQRTNSVSWEPRRSFTCANRVSPAYYSQGTSRGASVEMMVALANTLSVSPWFSIPHEAADSWITCHARAVATSLSRALRPRYEFSNETWNPTFRAFHDLSAAGVSAGLGDGDDFLALQQMTALRHIRSMRLIAVPFAAAQRPFTRVMAGQAANAWVLSQRLAHAGASAYTDEIAIAPYLHVPDANAFDAGEATAIAGMSLSELFAALATAQAREVDGWITEHVSLARQTGKRLVAYEGGQHLAGDSSNDALTNLFTSANRDPRMGALYRTYLARWKSLTGNALFVHFSDVGPYTRYGSWGALETAEQLTSPKYEALRRFAAGM